MSDMEVEEIKNQNELATMREFREVVGSYRYKVDAYGTTYLAQHLDTQEIANGTKLILTDAWVYDCELPVRAVKRAEIAAKHGYEVIELP